MCTQYYEAGKYSDRFFFVPKGILSNMHMLKKDDTFQNQFVFQISLWHTYSMYKGNNYIFPGWLNIHEFPWKRWNIWET